MKWISQQFKIVVLLFAVTTEDGLLRKALVCCGIYCTYIIFHMVNLWNFQMLVCSVTLQAADLLSDFTEALNPIGNNRSKVLKSSIFVKVSQQLNSATGNFLEIWEICLSRDAPSKRCSESEVIRRDLGDWKVSK